METHEIDPVALVFGLLFAFAGFAVIADRVWDDLDVAAVTGVGVAVVGIVLVAALVIRVLRIED